MLTTNTFALERMRKHLREMVIEQGEQLVEGSCRSYEEYRFYVGRCMGLQDALILCDTVEKELAET